MGFLDQVMVLEEIPRNFCAHLHGVPAVDKYGGAIAQHNKHTSRTREAAQPAQAFIVFGYILAQVFVSAGYDQSVKGFFDQQRPDGLQVFRNSRHRMTHSLNSGTSLTEMA